MRSIHVLGLGSILAAGTILAATPRSTSGDPSAIVVPPGMPRGDVELSSFGIATITTDDNVPLAALHVRALVSNWSDPVPWTFDVGDARLDGDVAPMLANSDVATLPIAIVDRGERAVIDLYFPLPAANLATFEVTLRVNANGRTFAPRASFVAEHRLAPLTSELALLGSGRAWWGAPSYAWPSFHHGDGIITPRAPRSAVVTRAPLHRYVTR